LDTRTTLRDSYILAPYHGACPPAPAWFKEALEHKPERTRFVSAGTNIELLTWGERGKPGLLFLHGNGANADWWSHVAPFFAADWRCAAMSFSGMGRSDRRAEGYIIEVFAQEAKDAIQAAGLLDGPALPIAICHSMGGMAGMAAAAETTIFRGLVLVDSPIRLDPARLAGIRAEAPKARNEHHVFQNLEDGLARFRLSPPQECKNDFIADYIARNSLVKNASGWSWHFDPRRVHLDAGHSERLIDNVKCPVAFIYGDQSAILSPGTIALSLPALPEGSPVIAIPDSAHHVMIDQPLALISAIRTLLASWPKKKEP
jgi:pimeloyl-ACP methyl ester carboxylesterase